MDRRVVVEESKKFFEYWRAIVRETDQLCLVFHFIFVVVLAGSPDRITSGP